MLPITTYPSSGTIAELVGIQNIVKVTTPAAGADWTYTLPAGYFYRIVGGSALFTTSAVVANRFAALQVTDGVNVLYTVPNPNAIVTTLAVALTYSQAGVTAYVAGTKPNGNVPAPSVWLPPGYIVSSYTSNIDVSDTYTKVVLWLEQLDFGQYGQRMLVHNRTINQLEATQEVNGGTAGQVVDNPTQGPLG